VQNYDTSFIQSLAFTQLPTGGGRGKCKWTIHWV